MELLKLFYGWCSLLPITPQKLDQRGERSNPLVSRVGTPFQKMTCFLLTWPLCWSFDIPFRQMQKTIACSTYYRIPLACSLQRPRVKRSFGYVCRKGIPGKTIKQSRVSLDALSSMELKRPVVDDNFKLLKQICPNIKGIQRDLSCPPSYAEIVLGLEEKDISVLSI